MSLPVIPASLHLHLCTPVTDNLLPVPVPFHQIRTSNNLNKFLMILWTGQILSPVQKKASYLTPMTHWNKLRICHTERPYGLLEHTWDGIISPYLKRITLNRTSLIIPGRANTHTNQLGSWLPCPQIGFARSWCV